MEVWVSNLPSLVWTHSPKMQTCEHDFTITIKMSRKQTDGGMSQLLAIAGLNSQSKAPNRLAWSNNHTQMSRNQTDGGISQAMPTLVWTHSSNLQTCEHDPTITLNCPGNKQMEAWVSYWPSLVWTHSPKMQTCEHDPTITLNCPENKQMEVCVSYWPSLVWTHSPKLQTCEHDLTITLRCPEIKQMEVWVSCLPLVVCTQLFAIAVLESQCKDANMWTWSNDHARLSRKQTDADLSQAMPTLVWTHSSNLQTCEHDPTITLNCPGNKHMEVWVSYCHRWSELTVQSSKQVSMI